MKTTITFQRAPRRGPVLTAVELIDLLVEKHILVADEVEEEILVDAEFEYVTRSIVRDRGCGCCSKEADLPPEVTEAILAATKKLKKYPFA